MGDTKYLLALHSINGFGVVRLKALLNYFKDPKLAWEASPTELLQIGIPKNAVEAFTLAHQNLNPEKYLEEIEKLGLKYLTIFDENYPKRLKQIYDPPMVLYYKGEILPIDDKAIGVVGTRKITGYGRLITEQFTSVLSQSGLTIISGLARGVDSVAHLTTLKVDGRTLAILGGGLKNIYPPENQTLANQIINGHGAVISEFPPDYPSTPGNFPARNRIISGLSLGILVTEAAIDSGSLITARLAIDQGREVFAIPGPITSSLSKGPADLIKDGAKLVSDPQEILDELGLTSNLKVIQTQLANLSTEEKQVLELLENESAHIDEIGRTLKLSSAQISGLILKMEIKGLVSNLGGGNYCKDANI